MLYTIDEESDSDQDEQEPEEREETEKKKKSVSYKVDVFLIKSDTNRPELCKKTARSFKIWI